MHALNFDQRIKFVRCLLKEHSIGQARDVYAQALAEEPNFRDAEIDDILRTTGIETGMDAESLLDELSSPGSFLEKPTINLAMWVACKT